MKEKKVLSQEELEILNKYFRVSNYIGASSLFLQDNVLLKRDLRFEDIKPRLVGHWGTGPGQSFIFTHLNRIIKKYDLNMIYIVGPGHGGQAALTNAYLEGSLERIYPEYTKDEKGLQLLCKKFSFPKGFSSHVSPEVPGSIHEGGELGYSLAHAFGAVLDNPSLIVTCIVGDGEAETGPLATSWNGIRFINPATDGAVLPILHLNGYKIANPTVLARMNDKDLKKLFEGYGYEPLFVEGDEPLLMHEAMASTLDYAINQIRKVQITKRNTNDEINIKWPMIILRTPKGWTGPKFRDNLPVENSFRAHQVPLDINLETKKGLEDLKKWLESYKPNELFNEDGSVLDEILSLIPKKNRRMGLNPNANGGLLLTDLILPDITQYETKESRGQVEKSDMMELGGYLRDVVKLNEKNKNFRIFGPDEALSNRLNKVFEVTKRKWNSPIIESDEYLAEEGRIIDSYLSEHLCEGMLEGYLLTGRHGFLHTYESFARVIDSMVSQHAKWLKITKDLPWRAPISSLNIILSSHIWQQDHNGYTHQEPGFLDHLATKKGDIANIYLPYDANSLIYTMDKCLKTKDKINAIVASKHMRPQWLTMEETIKNGNRGIAVWNFVSNAVTPDIIIASAGETPTLECLAAIKILKKFLKGIKIRYVNVLNLMTLQKNSKHEAGLTDEEFERYFEKDTPVLFAFHGYPNLIKSLIYHRQNKNFHIRGYIEEGSITTPFDMRVQNKIDRYHLAMSACNYISMNYDIEELNKYCIDMLEKHNKHIEETGIDMDEILNWKWEDENI